MSIPSFVIGIAGGTGAGKTTVAREVTESRSDSVTRIPLDNYYKDLSHLDFEERAEVNYDHPSAFEWELLREHLDSLLSGQAIEMPQYDFSVHNRKDERVTVEPTDVVVLEGILALYDTDVNEMLDLQVYVETDADVRILRRIERDVVDRGRDLEGVMDQYLSTVKPMHEQFVEPTKKHADLIIPEGANRVAVNLLEEKVRAETRSERAWEVEEELYLPDGDVERTDQTDRPERDSRTEPSGRSDTNEPPAATPNGGGERWRSSKESK
ncbi:uridine kinase [Haladaptatus sp. AB643]|uniref:uridine kinase n=1 Tax=Haladaptatus sp. AB643 TaxID=2934174 RepID=UPI00209C3B81|nr:uridine kinase [Haladaptatus sp. AB643]MCO8243812.1 uridine kinase [Haladaptatus sp. AB643]